MISLDKTFNLKRITTRPGVYQMLDRQGRVIYVGKAANLRKRLSSYFSHQIKNSKTAALLDQVTSIEVLVTRTENEALIIENDFIKKHRPKYNILFRDDKSYPYIYISEDPYPRIGLYRGMKSKKGRYFGPYPHVKAAHQTLNIIQKLFGIRTCRNAFFNSRTRPCLQYQIQRCIGPCVNLCSQTEYMQVIQDVIRFLEGKNVLQEFEERMEQASINLQYERAAHYRDQIKYLREVQTQQSSKGEADVIVVLVHDFQVCVDVLTVRNGKVLGHRSYIRKMSLGMTPEDIISTFLVQYYSTMTTSISSEIILNCKPENLKAIENVLSKQAEKSVHLRVHVRGQKRDWLKMGLLNAETALNSLDYSTNFSELFKKLQKITGFKKTIQKIACFDISHTQGTATVGSCVVFDVSGPVKKAYRHFNVRGVVKGDDVAAMYQTLMRYFSKTPKEALCDMLLVDGGKTQLAQADKILTELHLKERVVVLGVAKDPSRQSGLEKIYQQGQAEPLKLSFYPKVLSLILRIRDEAHRFAIRGHRRKRQKMMTQSILETIPGVGAKRRRDLLKHFGGLQGLLGASCDDLTAVSGVGKSLAKQIYDILH